MMITDKNFADWHAHVFGYGYGSGEEYWLPALHELLTRVVKTREASGVAAYGFREVEAQFGSLAGWLLINALCGSDIFEYGTSPRYGWLTSKGSLLADYMRSRTVEQIADIVDNFPSDNHCLRGYCNEVGKAINCNPLFGQVAA